MRGLALSFLLASSAAAFISVPSRRHHNVLSSVYYSKASSSFLTRSSRKTSTRLFVSTESGTNLDVYQILGVSRNADLQEIKSAYRNLAKRYHPDANPGFDTTEKFQEINRAYEVLTDRLGNQAGGWGVAVDLHDLDNMSDSFFRDFGRVGGPRGARVDRNGVEAHEHDIFDPLYGEGAMPGGPSGARVGTRRAGARAGAQPGTHVDGRVGARPRGPVARDLRVNLEIDFKTGVFGGEVNVPISHLATCDTCQGIGAKPGSKFSKCNTCNGSGVTVQRAQNTLGNMHMQHQTCPSCNGMRRIIEEYCGTCGGQGVNEKTKQIRVEIPPGVENGVRLRLRGEGNAGAHGGLAGDLYVYLQVKDDPNLRREGPDIYSVASIGYVDAILGGSIKTPVVDGEVTLKVPPGTQPGQVMRLKGKGAPHLDDPMSRGDHYVAINVEMPKDLSMEEEKLMEKLKNLSGER